MERVQIPIERIRTLYALIGAVNDATNETGDFAVSISLEKHMAYVHITDMRDDANVTSKEYMYAPDHTFFGPAIHEDDENLTGAETALVEILEMLNNDR